MEIASIHQLNKVYEEKVENHVLFDVHFSIGAGEFLGILGPSGSGKTTLLNIIGGFDYPTSGEVIIGDKNPYQLTSEALTNFRRKKLGFVFQSYNLLPSLTVKENIILPLVLDKVSGEVIEEKINIMADQLDISSILYKRIYEITNSQIQRVVVGRAAIHEPELLIVDEPTSNLDSEAARSMMDTFAWVHQKRKTSILLVTQDPKVASYCERVMFMQNGKLIDELSTQGSRQVFLQSIIDKIPLVAGGKYELFSVSL